MESTLLIIGAVGAVLLGVYLMFALMRPEDFS